MSTCPTCGTSKNYSTPTGCGTCGTPVSCNEVSEPCPDIILWERAVTDPVALAVGSGLAKFFVTKHDLKLTRLSAEVEDAALTIHLRIDETYFTSLTIDEESIKDNFYATKDIEVCVAAGKLIEIFIPDPELGSADTEPVNLSVELQGYAT